MKTIVKIKDLYTMWSTVIDRPVTPAYMMPINLYLFMSSDISLVTKKVIFDKMIRHSNKIDLHDDMVKNNRAGDNDKNLTINELHDKYKVRDEDFPEVGKTYAVIVPFHSTPYMHHGIYVYDIRESEMGHDVFLYHPVTSDEHVFSTHEALFIEVDPITLKQVGSVANE